ncbi:MAG TPA: UMP kinase [bacterium]|nr:MAG: Uridylate kinase [Parcubacteria group bacterium ADurb.Bin192]HPN15266.1 UMP kinase [bacterium]
MKKGDLFVISLGGSILVPNGGVDLDFLKGFARLIKSRITKGDRFVIVVGGGSTARFYQRAARAVGRLADEDVDWLGIHATRLNAHLLRSVFREQALHRVIKDPREPLNWNKSLLIAAGWKPGWSTDYVAVRLAKRFAARQVINLSNVSVVYDKDPNAHADARPINQIKWTEFCRLVGSKWIPGMNVPFDPIASKAASKWRMQAVIANGRDLKNLQKIFNGQKFVGTVIS